MKIYLCGPMTIIADDLNHAVFNEAANTLRHMGHDIFNPAEVVGDLTYEQCMRVDLGAVLASDAVAVLPRWREGVGTRVEVAVGLAIGIPVYTYTPDGLALLYSATAGRGALRDLLDGVRA